MLDIPELFEASPERGKLRGIGGACYAELTGLGTSTAVGPGTLLQPGRDAVTLRLETTGVPSVAAALATVGGWLWSRLPDAKAGEVKREYEPKNPLELRAAFAFAVLFMLLVFRRTLLTRDTSTPGDEIGLVEKPA